MPDLQIRLAAFEWLREQTAVSGETLAWSALLRGFTWHGDRIPLVSQQGIFKPRVCALPLSVRTAPGGPYDDQFEHDGRIRYAYRGTDPHHRENAGLRELMRTRTPLVYLYGIMPGRHVPAWPVYVVNDQPSRLLFTLELADTSVLANPERLVREPPSPDDRESVVRRQYAAREFRVRLHQQGFRERVLRAYREQCAMCRLRHRELLDAAHIIPDSEPGGEPELRNGLSLCKLHHAAYDRLFVGVDPGGVIVVRRDILEEHDGPMLLHGLKGLHGKRIHMPGSPGKKPDPDRLKSRFQKFLEAGA